MYEPGKKEEQSSLQQTWFLDLPIVFSPLIYGFFFFLTSKGLA
jgi:hypothetical protein